MLDTAEMSRLPPCLMSVDCLFCPYFSFRCLQDYEKVMEAGGDKGDMVPVLVTAEMSREQVVEAILKTEENQ